MRTKSWTVFAVAIVWICWAAAAAADPMPVGKVFPFTFTTNRTVGRTYPFTFTLSDSMGAVVWWESRSYKVPANFTITHLLGSVVSFENSTVQPPVPPVDFSHDLVIAVSSGKYNFQRKLAAIIPYANWSAAAAALVTDGYAALRVTPYDPLADPDDPADDGKLFSPSMIGGHLENNVSTTPSSSAVVGAVVAGGGAHLAPNAVHSNFSTVGGGLGNQAGDPAASATSHRYITIGGGMGNSATRRGAVVGGGEGNAVSGSQSVVGGGEGNIVSGSESVVGGGARNVIGGSEATIPGGSDNNASGNLSLAAGFGAYAANDGTFVWGDASNSAGLVVPFRSTTENQFAVRATGGALFVTEIDGSGNPSKGIRFGAGGGFTVVTSFSCDTDAPPICTPATGWNLDLTTSPPSFVAF